MMCQEYMGNGCLNLYAEKVLAIIRISQGTDTCGYHTNIYHIFKSPYE